MNRIFIFAVCANVLFSCPIISKGQLSKKESKSFYKQLLEIEVSDIKNGQHLNVARELQAEKFVQYYLESGKKNQDKKYGGLVSFEELYKDSIFTYFGRTYTYGLIDFVKVLNNEFPYSDFMELDGVQIRKQFIAEIIPEEDKIRVRRKEKGCMSSSNFEKFEYSYIKKSNELEVKYHWRIKCDFTRKIIDKVYIGRYGIEKGKFL